MREIIQLVESRHIFLFVVFLLIISSCKKNNDVITPPVEEPGKQKNIEWPSLAKSPWPMLSGSPQFTWRTTYTGPKTGTKIWQLLIPGVNSTIGLTSPVMGEDSTIYFASSYEPGAFLYACSQSGNIKWKVRLGKDSSDVGSLFVDTTPIVLSDGSIVIATPRGYVLSFSPLGKLQWVFETGNIPIFSTTISVGKNGEFYFIDKNSYLYSLTSTGTLNWKVKYDAGFDFSANGGVAISPDGNTLYVNGMSDTTSLYAISTNGNLKWVFDAKMRIGAIPLVDNAGNIYIGTAGVTSDTTNLAVYSIKSDGTVRWKYKKQHNIFQNLSMDANGNIYLSDHTISADALISLDYYGNLRWSYNQLNRSINSGIMCDGDNSVYAFTNELLIFSEAGLLLRNYSVTPFVLTTPMVGFANSLIVTSISSLGNYLIKIK